MKFTVGMLAGELSGDNLGAGLMRQLRAQLTATDEIEFVGIGGPQMLAAGLRSFAPMDLLAVNGFRDPIMRLPSLLRLLRGLRKHFSHLKIDAFVGVDFNVFNFLLEKSLKQRGIKTVHYVSPSVYAWRAGRTRRLAKCADLLLCLYPFEPEFYAQTAVQAEYVGHPLADEIDPQAGNQAARLSARAALSLGEQATVLAVLPGSRNSEIELLIEDFLDAAGLFSTGHPQTQIVVPCPRPELRKKIDQAVARHPGLDIVTYDGNARQALLAADVALVKSGTSTLEALLIGRPMVVSYRLGRLTYQFARRVLRTPYIALPNILAGEALVPELLQDEGTAYALAAALATELHQHTRQAGLEQRFAELHAQLRQGADEKAAAAVLRLLQNTG